ncbi:hypothetical protein Sjap_001664 [Stephania japonica]|uniref:Pentatricopeptide repeat-containing protein n=1 Tax=Stephania japonica TaxID=461633 RepID=A0AAP0KMP0_9MAGN
MSRLSSLKDEILPIGTSCIKQVLASLRRADCGLDYRACAQLLHRCSDRHLVRQGKQIHARIVLGSITPDNYLASSLLTFYSKTGHIVAARNVFDKIPNTNVFSCNAMLIAYSHHDQHLQLLHLFSDLTKTMPPILEPDNYTITAVVKALSVIRPDPCCVREVHGYVMRRGWLGFNYDVFVVNALITMYGKAGELDSARRVFNGTATRDVVSWNSMLAGYSHGGLYEECLRLYREMDGGFKPNAVTMMSVLQACAQLKDLVTGMEVHKFIVESEMEADVFIDNSIIGMYAKCGRLDYARESFDAMKVRDEISYGSMISGYLVHGMVDKAMELFREVEKPSLSTWNAVVSGLVQNNQYDDIHKLVHEMQARGCRPNDVTLSSVLPSFSYFSNLKVGREIHCYAIRNNYDCNIYIATALIDIYAKTGGLHAAHRVFRRCGAKSVIVWTAIISACAAKGDSDTALALFAEMLVQGTKPDPVAFIAVLSACAHSGVVDEARRIFESMLPEFGISPAVEHYACMVGTLSRAGLVHEAVDFISKMPVEPSAKVWGALLNGVSVCGDVELGEFVFDKLVEIEPHNTGNYIIMANLYSQAGRWREAEDVRQKMKNMNLKKIAGFSWIDTSSGLQSFVAGDSSSQQSEEIYVVLEVLVEMMREEGYVTAVKLDEESICS